MPKWLLASRAILLWPTLLSRMPWASVMLAGKAQNVDFDASSGASISGDKLTAANGKAEASSGASVSVSANVNLEAEASSGGRVRYSGNPTMVNVSSSSGGSISRL